jgi:hypothetical protein
MTTYAGGLRDRLIHDSVFNLVKTGLDTLGWFPGGPQAPIDDPINLVSQQMDWSSEIPLNTISVSAYSTSDTEWELGSDLRENRWTFYVDVFGANEAIGLQLSGDVRDILRGKFSALSNYVTPETLHVYDWTLATPVEIFYCDINAVTRDRAVQTSHRWMNYMFSIQATLLDYYNTDQDDFYLGQDP